MNRIDRLLESFRDYVTLPWHRETPPQQRVWCVIHKPEDERSVRARIREFEEKTVAAGHGWHAVDLTDRFGKWLGAHPYRDEFFDEPVTIGPALDLFRNELVAEVRGALTTHGPNDAVALCGVSALFGVMKVAELLDAVGDAVGGRLVVFFPGTHRDGVYKLLDARDGWNYHAIPIKADDPET